MTSRQILYGYLGIVLYTVAPVLSVLLSSGIASTLGCELNEADAHKCLCCGVDIGEPLTVMFVMGWLALVTLPTGALALVGFTIFWIVSKAMERRKKENAN